jgi:hypothetical protein
MLHTLSFFPSSKCRLFHNATFLGSCIIHILNTGVLKFKRKFQRLKVNILLRKSCREVNIEAGHLDVYSITNSGLQFG